MTVDEFTNKLLFVPFNKDYKVEDYVKDLLTEDEFFEHCFLKPCEDLYIKKALIMNSQETKDFEIDFDKKAIQERLTRQKEESSALETWIASKQSDIYCIKGDAGTGKTTYLHYLKYNYRDEPIVWHLIDIQNATEDVSILGHYVKMPNFNFSLYSKAISVLLLHFKNSFYVFDNNKVCYAQSVDNIDNICKKFTQKFEDFFPRIQVCEFYNQMKDIIDPPKKTAKEKCVELAAWMSKWSIELLKNSNNISTAFSIFLEIYIYYIMCNENNYHHMIAFDNFERFIGTDEIYNEQLTEFVSNLRSIQNTITINNKHLSNTYQIMIFMRNTSVRMFTSQQVTEFFAHTVDLSDWFDASSILKKKINWYKNHDITFNESKVLLSILEDMGACGSTLRGLHFKISMLFNYNKRLVIRFLSRVIIDDNNQKYIEKYLYYLEECASLKPYLYKFAARSIIYRLVLNALKNDGFFVNIVDQKNTENKKTPIISEDCEHATIIDDTSSLGYARKILMILNEHKIQNTQTEKNNYISFLEIAKKLYYSQNNEQLLFNECNKEKMNIISQVLFYMNYYDGRKENWLQFIDIQYNFSDVDSVTISTYQDLEKYIISNPNDVKIRITNAGLAYLFFVVYYFEFFSCKNSLSSDIEDLQPLLFTIPTPTQITNIKPEDLECIKIMERVKNDALSCISLLNNDPNQQKFRPDLHSRYKTHQERIVNSHKGYLGNFMQCLFSLYKEECKNEQFSKKLNNLISIIKSIQNEYYPTYKKEVKNED